MKKRVFLLFSIVPFLLGVGFASLQGKHTGQKQTSFNLSAILLSDVITVSNKGDIIQLSGRGTTQITHDQDVIEPVFVGSSFFAVHKALNYATLLEFNQSGNKEKTIFDGNAPTVDSMNWITDPAVNHVQTKLLYVSDKERMQTNIPDNALYEEDLITGKVTSLAKPDPYSGGIAHPFFDSVNDTIIFYDYYQYDGQTLLPYSTIEQYSTKTDTVQPLTFEAQNAYQGSISPDGKQFLFLGRNTGDSVTLYIANYDIDKGFSHINVLAVGDFAYPAFSFTKNHIYFLEATGNNGYNLVTATIQNGRLIKKQIVIDGNTLLGTSSYSITKD